MENVSKANTSSVNASIMTLQGYYAKLPEATYPKSDFIKEVANRCNVTATTVRNWIKYGMKPNNPDHIRILVDLTGITAENLWNK